ncbi:MAG: hypothetical protein CUR34_11695 [Sediminibacterium sp.]|nr:MAG: hypothetical protein CUR34_11695 [Sediminibacterium sp.] [Sediminibacterium sp. FEMGT703S]
MKFFIIIILLPSLSFGQSKIDFGRYTKVWVLNTSDEPQNLLLSENTSIKSNNFFPNSKLNELSLYIPGNNNLIFKNGNKYILSYLINNSIDTISIDRCDATIYPAETQILVNSEWKTFQISMGSSCGNSYFKSGLLPKSFYTLHIERPFEGDVPTKFRVKLKFGNKEYFSNVCSIKLTKEEIQKSNLPIKPLSL